MGYKDHLSDYYSRMLIHGYFYLHQTKELNELSKFTLSNYESNFEHPILRILHQLISQ